MQPFSGIHRVFRLCVIRVAYELARGCLANCHTHCLVRVRGRHNGFACAVYMLADRSLTVLCHVAAPRSWFQGCNVEASILLLETS